MDQVARAVSQYNKIASQYSENISGLASVGEMEKFIALLPLQPYVIDVGCAAGRDVKIFYDKGIKIVGVDLSDGLLGIAKKKYPTIDFRKGDMRSLPFLQNTFDGLWSNAVFHHLQKNEMTPVLKEFSRVLKKNGILFLRTKWGEELWKGADILSVGERREFSLLKEEELAKMLEESGFKKIEMYKKKDDVRDLYWIFSFYRKTTE